METHELNSKRSFRAIMRMLRDVVQDGWERNGGVLLGEDDIDELYNMLFYYFKDKKPIGDKLIGDNIFPFEEPQCKTVKNVLDRLMCDFSINNCAEDFLKKCPSMSDTIKQHHFLGRRIRNRFGLWGEEGSHGWLIVQDAYKNYEDPVDGRVSDHPDDVSALILNMLWQRLRDKE